MQNLVITHKKCNIKDLYQKHIAHLRQFYSKTMNDQGYPGILIEAGDRKLRFLDDNHYSYRLNPHFAHWLPLEEIPQCFLWLKGDEKPVLYYFEEHTFWHKAAGRPEGYWTDSFEIVMVSDEEAVVKDLKRRMGAELARALAIGETSRFASAFGISHFNISAYLNEVHFMRTMKTEYEIVCMEEATYKAAPAHQKLQSLFASGQSLSEFQLHLEYLKAIKGRECDLPYDNIIAFNENAAILHYTDYNAEVTANSDLRTLLVDAGGRFANYCSDITRTYVSEREQREHSLFAQLLHAMEKMQLAIVAQLAVGQQYLDNHLLAHSEIAKILLEHKLVTGMTPEEMVEKKVSHKFFPHGLGHSLGIQVHDVGGYLGDGKGKQNKPPEGHPYLRLVGEIRAGNVFTIEPGLYFIPMLLADLKKSEVGKNVNWKLVDSLIPYGGIRIEDNIHVTEHGFDNLTRKHLR